MLSSRTLPKPSYCLYWFVFLQCIQYQCFLKIKMHTYLAVYLLLEKARLIRPCDTKSSSNVHWKCFQWLFSMAILIKLHSTIHIKGWHTECSDAFYPLLWLKLSAICVTIDFLFHKQESLFTTCIDRFWQLNALSAVSDCFSWTTASRYSP